MKKILIVVLAIVVSLSGTQTQAQIFCAGTYEVVIQQKGIEVLTCVRTDTVVPLAEFDISNDDLLIIESFKLNKKIIRKFFILYQEVASTQGDAAETERHLLFFYNTIAGQWQRVIWPHETEDEPLQIVDIVVGGMSDQFLSVYTTSKIVLEFQYTSTGIWRFVQDKSINSSQ